MAEYDYEEDFDDNCLHASYEYDVLTNRAECDCCGHRWFLSDTEFASYEKLMRESYDPEDLAPTQESPTHD